MCAYIQIIISTSFDETKDKKYFLCFAGKAKTTRLDGRNILDSDPTWTLAPGLGHAYMTVPVSPGAHLIDHPDRTVDMGVFAYGHSGNGAESYGFSAGMSGDKNLILETILKCQYILPTKQTVVDLFFG